MRTGLSARGYFPDFFVGTGFAAGFFAFAAAVLAALLPAG